MQRLGRIYKRVGASAVIVASALLAAAAAAEPVAVRHTEGSLRGFLVLRSLDDQILADGELTQTVRGDRVTAKLVFRFKDGSTHEETTVYSQREQLQLISDRIVQKGPSFPQPLEMTVEPRAKRPSLSGRQGGATDGDRQFRGTAGPRQWNCAEAPDERASGGDAAELLADGGHTDAPHGEAVGYASRS